MKKTGVMNYSCFVTRRLSILKEASDSILMRKKIYSLISMPIGQWSEP